MPGMSLWRIWRGLAEERSTDVGNLDGGFGEGERDFQHAALFRD
jgi:hypothetical protein